MLQQAMKRVQETEARVQQERERVQMAEMMVQQGRVRFQRAMMERYGEPRSGGVEQMSWISI